jgi:hypothetical protein
MRTWLTAALAALVLLMATPLAAQQYDGIDNDNDGQIDEPDEYDGAGMSSDRLETECIATARPEVCVTYHQFACQTLGQPAACQFAQMGQNCFGGDPGQCQYYVGLITANRDCYAGNADGCAYLRSQGAGG